MAKIFFGAPRQSGKKTLFIVILGQGGQNLVFRHFGREAPKEKVLDNFGSKNMDFGSMGRGPRGGGVFGPDPEGGGGGLGHTPLLPPHP